MHSPILSRHLPICRPPRRNWTGLDWTGLDWTRLDWTGLGERASPHASCASIPRCATRLHGGVVKWGEKNILPDAAACCAACQATAGCNVWVYCSSAQRCGKRHQQCWLKKARDLWALKENKSDVVVGTSDAWTSGTQARAQSGFLLA